MRIGGRPARSAVRRPARAAPSVAVLRAGGNAEVLRQNLKRELSFGASLRTVERAVAPSRRLPAAEATVRFETPPGGQLQIDFRERRVPVADGTVRAHLFVATLGYRGGSTRMCWRASASPRGSRP